MGQNLNKTIEKLISSQKIGSDEFNVSIQEYIETLSVSKASEIKDMIDFIYEEYYMECPFWVKLIAFRILISEFPDDDEMKKWLEADARMFYGPDWVNYKFW
jgi:hypothetical protein